MRMLSASSTLCCTRPSPCKVRAPSSLEPQAPWMWRVWWRAPSAVTILGGRTMGPRPPRGGPPMAERPMGRPPSRTWTWTGPPLPRWVPTRGRGAASLLNIASVVDKSLLNLQQHHAKQNLVSPRMCVRYAGAQAGMQEGEGMEGGRGMDGRARADHVRSYSQAAHYTRNDHSGVCERDTNIGAVTKSLEHMCREMQRPVGEPARNQAVTTSRCLPPTLMCTRRSTLAWCGARWCAPRLNNFKTE